MLIEIAAGAQTGWQGGTPEEFKTFLANERKKWGDLLRCLNIKAR